MEGRRRISYTQLCVHSSGKLTQQRPGAYCLQYQLGG